MNEESWGFYVSIEEEYLIKDKEKIELIERNDNDDIYNDDIYIIRRQATFIESVCGIWRLLCFIIFRNRK